MKRRKVRKTSGTNSREQSGNLFQIFWHRRRFLLSAVLLVALGIVIFKMSMMPPRNSEKYIPDLVAADSGDPGNSSSSTIDSALSNGKFGRASEGSVSDDEILYSLIKGGSPAIGSAKDQEAVSHDPILDGGSADQLVETILLLRDSWKRRTAPAAFLMNQRRATLAERLMELDVDQTKQVFALSEYIESIINLDFLASREHMETRSVRVSLEAIVQKYKEHESLPVRSKAALASLSIPLHDFLRSRKTLHLDNFLSDLEKSGGAVLEDRYACDRLCGSIGWLRKVQECDGTVLPYCLALLKKIRESGNPEVQNLARVFSDYIYFGHLEIHDLVSRLEQGDQEVLPLIQQFFRGIDANPNCRVVIYKIAIGLIKKNKNLEQREEFESRMKCLSRITEKLDSDEVKSALLKAIEELEALPWGPPQVESDVQPEG